jgi:hypothetical protein
MNIRREEVPGRDDIIMITEIEMIHNIYMASGFMSKCATMHLRNKFSVPVKGKEKRHPHNQKSE